eukprot:2600262-Rhodomonas_salina.1
MTQSHQVLRYLLLHAARLCFCTDAAVCGTSLLLLLRSQPLCPSALSRRCAPILRAPPALWPELTQPRDGVACLRYAVSGTGVPHGSVCLRACYALSGTDIVCGAICLRARCPVSGTDRAYGYACLRVCYAVSGTAIPHAHVALCRLYLPSHIS